MKAQHIQGNYDEELSKVLFGLLESQTAKFLQVLFSCSAEFFQNNVNAFESVYSCYQREVRSRISKVSKTL